MKELLTTAIGLGVLAAAYIFLTGDTFHAGAAVMQGAATAGRMVP